MLVIFQKCSIISIGDSVDFNKLRNIINDSSNVFIMGHKGIDLDALGASLGMLYICKSFMKDAYIVIEDTEYDLTVSKTIDELTQRNFNINFYKTNEVLPYIDENSLLIIVDVNKYELMSSNELFDVINNKIVVDHHNLEKEINNVSYYINDKASSVCEILVDLLKFYKNTIPSFIASIMLGGIMIDTNNFTLKTNYNTYLAASFLTQLGANNTDIEYLLKEDISEYFNIQEIISNVIIIDEKYALCVCDNKIYDKEFLAKISSIILGFANIELSWAIGKISENVVGISARSIGNLDVSEYVSPLGGGGSNIAGAAQLENVTLEEVKDKVRDILRTTNL